VDTKFFDSTAGLRGLKGQLYEGGIRASLIVRWPGHVAPGTSSGALCAGWDLMPTLVEACGAEAPPGIDGRSLVPLLTGGAAPARDELYWEYPDNGGWQAVRMGDWKAVRRNLKKNIPSAIEIYDLAQDPGETRDVAGQHPELVKRALEAFATRTESPIPEWNYPRAR
jgi:arylsulfatase A-like enzyme